MPESSPAATNERARWRKRIIRTTSWLIPPIFACAAALLHFELHVPRSKMVPRAKDDKGKTKPKPAPSKRQPWQPREQAELDALRVRFEPNPIADEPDEPDFRRQHDSLLRAVAQLAREAALTERPTSLRVIPHCHTVRCSLEICGPTTAVAAIALQIAKVERKDGPLWHELREVDPETKPEAAPAPESPDAPEVEAQACRAWVVGFRVDGSKRGDLVIPGYEPKRPAPVKPAIVPSDSTQPVDASKPDPTRPAPAPKAKPAPKPNPG